MNPSPVSKLIVGMLCGCSLGTVQAAESYPSRPVRLIIPYSPGGAADAVAKQAGSR